MKRLDQLELQDIEALRLVLLGTSVIDWQRLAFTERQQVNQFLRLCQFDPDSPADKAWMLKIVDDAVKYLNDTFRYRIPNAVAQPAEVQDLFLLAAGSGGRLHQKMACIVLKICHVIHHIEGRDLLHRLPLAEEDFGTMAEQRVRTVFERLGQLGAPIREAYSSAKTRASVISKLLQKAETLAAEVYDRTRFRIVVEERANVLPVLQEFTQQLFPFHLVVPGQSHNSLIDFRAICESTPGWAPHLGKLQFGLDFAHTGERNTFSGSNYQMLKFVVDLPLRIPDALISPEIQAATHARIVHCLVEIQIVDAATAAQNERGENDHARYKRRQKLHILRRLSHGLANRKQNPNS